jgi:redox-sensitive bicupin YhaK (pirin superfamily)
MDHRRGPNRREVLAGMVAGATLTALPGCQRSERKERPAGGAGGRDPVDHVMNLRTPWQTFDPFLFCVHHDDAYPAGNGVLGPAAALDGRDLGQDFVGLDGWRMYHGGNVPGFPQHPHRGFETVTVVRRGFVDHSDSLGATARYGAGDTQWLTAGAGIQHAEMFPLIERDGPNPLELFQIWLNLPKVDKFAAPHFSMLWRERIPVRQLDGVTVTVIAGAVGDARAPAPPPSSWAANADNDVAIWTITMAAGARWTLPATVATSARTLYFARGEALTVGSRTVSGRVGVRLHADVAAELVAGDTPVELLLLQGRPIGEPVVQRGPFVMNTRDEIVQAHTDYRATGFGGWPWPSLEPVHERDAGRFAVHADGRRERAG